MTDLQRAIQSTIQRPLSQRELYEAECNLVGLFDVLVKINERERIVDTHKTGAYANAL